MKTEDNKIGLIYEALVRGDVFSLSDELFEKYNWDIFFDSVLCGFFYTVLIEDYAKVIDNQSTRYGLLDQYNITLHNGSKFVLNINYNNATDTRVGA